MVKDKLGDLDNEVEIKLFPGLCVTSKCIPFDQSNIKSINSKYDDSTYILRVNSRLSDRFKREIKNK